MCIENINKFAQFANRVFGVEPDFEAPYLTALEGIKRFKHFYHSLGLPVSLKT